MCEQRFFTGIYVYLSDNDEGFVVCIKIKKINNK